MRYISKGFLFILFGLLIGILPLITSEAQSGLIFDISRQGTTSTYIADSRTNTSFYTGSLKFVVESAVNEANIAGGGSMIFTAGDFDLGLTWFNLTFISNITFQG